MKFITAEWQKTGIGVIAVLSFLIAGAVSAHAADLQLDCPEDNTFVPSPPQMLKKNVTPYTYVPLPKPPPKAPAAPVAVPIGKTYYHDLLQPLNSVQLPPGKYTWTDTEMQFSPYYLTTAGNLGLKDADGNIIPGASSVFNKWGLHGQCGGNNADCIVVNAYFNGANLPYYKGITDQILKVDTIVTDFLEYYSYAVTWIKANGVDKCVNSICYKNGVVVPNITTPPTPPKFADWVVQKYQ